MKYRLCLLWYKGQEISDFECSLNVKAVTHSQVFAIYMELLTVIFSYSQLIRRVQDLMGKHQNQIIKILENTA